MTKARITVIASCLADGTKLPLLIIFKGTTRRTIKNIVAQPEDAILKFNESAWSSAEISREWLDEIWFPNIGNRDNILVWDEFKGHTTCQIGDEERIYPVIIPPKCTPIVQPIDVSIGKALKDRIRISWALWKRRNLNENDKRPPSKQSVVNWVIKAWRDIPVSVVSKSFISCGISNDLAGTEEHLCNINVNRIV